jgi:purine-cytosine permease-like protein
MSQATAELPSAHGVETHGVESIPEAERTAGPWSVATILIGGNLSFSVVVFGWLPMTFGLSFWATITSILIGCAIGAALTAPLGLLGVRTGTTNSVSSGADFGVVGRMIGSFMSLLLAVGYLALAVWAGGDSIVASAHRLIGTPLSDFTRAIGYVITTIGVVAVAVYGYRVLATTMKWLIPVAGVLLLLGIVALAPDIDLGRAGGEYALGSFWSTWALAVTLAASGPISYATYLGDWTRYIGRSNTSDGRLLAVSALGLFLAIALTAILGAVTATAFPDLTVNYVEALVLQSPSWYLLPILVLGIIGTVGQGAIGLYGTGLDLEAIVPQLRRTQATVVCAVIGLALIFLGTFVFSAEDSISAFVVVLTCALTPWMAIVLVGYVGRRGVYDPDALQVFNRGERGGRYWYWHGWNPTAVIAWILGTACGLMFSASTLFTGPWANVANGIDLSFLSAFLVGAVIYAIALAVRRTPGELPAPAALVPDTETTTS